MNSIDETLIQKLEEESPKGLTSSEILGFFEAQGVAFSEASLRKYVQLGLLPRSVRVGQKGKHRGSKGVYPVCVLRQILWIKRMLSESYTIEQIQGQFLFLRSEIEDLDRAITQVIDKLKVATNGEGRTSALCLNREINVARGVGSDLMGRLRTLEQRVVGRAEGELEMQSG